MKTDKNEMKENLSVEDEFLSNNFISVLISYLENCNDYRWMFIKDSEDEISELFKYD